MVCLNKFTRTILECFDPYNTSLKVGLLPSKKMFDMLHESPSKMIKNAFYLILKAFFVLKIFKCLSWLFGPAEKTAKLER